MRASRVFFQGRTYTMLSDRDLSSAGFVKILMELWWGHLDTAAFLSTYLFCPHWIALTSPFICETGSAENFYK